LSSFLSLQKRFAAWHWAILRHGLSKFGGMQQKNGEKNSNHPLDFQPYAKAHPQRDRPAADSHPSMGPSSGLERKAFSLRLM
jgi:hypothetical protein